MLITGEEQFRIGGWRRTIGRCIRAYKMGTCEASDSPTRCVVDSRDICQSHAQLCARFDLVDVLPAWSA